MNKNDALPAATSGQEKRQPKELVFSALEHFSVAKEEFFLGTIGLNGAARAAVEEKLDEVQEIILTTAVSVLVPPADLAEEGYNEALDRWDVLKTMIKFDGPAGAVNAKAARAYADACERTVSDCAARKAAELA